MQVSWKRRPASYPQTACRTPNERRGARTIRRATTSRRKAAILDGGRPSHKDRRCVMCFRPADADTAGPRPCPHCGKTVFPADGIFPRNARSAGKSLAAGVPSPARSRGSRRAGSRSPGGTQAACRARCPEAASRPGAGRGDHPPRRVRHRGRVRQGMLPARLGRRGVAPCGTGRARAARPGAGDAHDARHARAASCGNEEEGFPDEPFQACRGRDEREEMPLWQKSGRQGPRTTTGCDRAPGRRRVATRSAAESSCTWSTASSWR